MFDSGRIGDRSALAAWLRRMRRRAAWHDWRWQLRHALGAEDLARLGLLADTRAAAAARRYRTRVTPYYLALGGLPGAPDGSAAVRRQWLPAAGELRAAPEASADPFAEIAQMPVPGVVHRFADRVLLLVSSDCAVNCRHCTRKDSLATLPLARSAAALRRAAAYVRGRVEVREAIISGGDPLLLEDAALLRVVRVFAELPRIDAVRIGSRVPVTLPMRVTAGLARALGRFRKVWFNTQFNHADELTSAAAAACGRLVDAGIPVSNQAVLLRGLNDTADELARLCAGLQRIRVRPYYVFVCDPARGTAHFRVSRAAAARLARVLAARLGGLAVPRFVADVAGAPAKLELGAAPPARP